MRLARTTLAALGAAAVGFVSVGTAVPAYAADPVSGGFADAKGIIVNLTVLTAIPVPGQLGNTPLDPNTFASSTQSCPPNVGKPAPDTLLNVPASPAATAAAVDTLASAQCTATEAAASAAAQTVGLAALINAGVPTITADVIRAQANSDCTKAPNGDGSVFTNLKIAGQAIGGSPAPNTVIPLPGIGVVIVNEQHYAADGRGFVVNGLHIIGTGPLLRGDLIISHATSGVVCPNGKGSEGAPPLKPDITFDKTATPNVAQAGDTVTYSTTVTNTSAAPCDVLSYIDHLDPAFDFVSTDGAFGKTPVMPLPKRGENAVDVVLRPTGLVIAPGKSVTQTFVVKLKGTVQPGTYYNNLEIFCATNGNFVSGPLAPVTVPAPVVAAPPAPAPAPQELPRTGATPLLAGAALLLLLGAAGVARTARV